jgi:hypothetical protein
MIDDLDGTEITEGEGEQIEFAFRGVSYRIDLADTNVAKLEAALAPFIDSAAKVSGTPRRSRGRKAGRSAQNRSNGKATESRSSKRTPARGRKEQPAAIRAWASRHGHTVSSRGRIPAEIIAAYEAAQGR